MVKKSREWGKGLWPLVPLGFEQNRPSQSEEETYSNIPNKIPNVNKVIEEPEVHPIKDDSKEGEQTEENNDFKEAIKI